MDQPDYIRVESVFSSGIHVPAARERTEQISHNGVIQAAAINASR